MRRFAPIASLGACTAAALLWALPVQAQPSSAGAAAPAQAQPAEPDPVVARVDGQEIKLSDLQEATRLLPEEVRGAPPQMLYPLLLDQLIAQQALVNAARAQGLDRDPQVQARIRRAEEQELQQALITREIAGEVTEEAVRARFERDQAARQPEEELRARHILVASEGEARQVLAELKRPNADFAEIARRRSTSPDGRQGGDLGFFKRGDMVPEFAEAAFALSPGQTSAEPVRSPFGWHVIRAEERRAAPPPAFEEVRDSLRQAMLEEAVNDVVERTRSAAKVERFNLDGSPQGGGQTEQQRSPSLLDNAAPPPAQNPRR